MCSRLDCVFDQLRGTRVESVSVRLLSFNGTNSIDLIERGHTRLGNTLVWAWIDHRGFAEATTLPHQPDEAQMRHPAFQAIQAHRDRKGSQRPTLL